MKAIVQDRYGSAEVLDLREPATPLLASNEVLIRVRAAGLNVADPHIMRGSPPCCGWCTW